MIIGAVWLWSRSLGAAAPLLPLEETTGQADLQPFASLYRDPTGRMTLAQVRQESAQGRFTPFSGSAPSLGFTSDAVWARVAVQNQGSIAGLWFLALHTARMDEVDVYLIRADDQIEHFFGGNEQARDPRSVDDKYPVFPARLNAGETLECFVRIKSETAIQLRLALWNPSAFAGAESRAGFYYAGFFGYLTALIILGIIIGLFTREPGFVSYSAAVVSLFLFVFILSGYCAWLGFPGRAFLAKKGLILAGEFAVGMILANMRQSLDLRSHLPRLDRWVVWSIWGSGVLGLVLFASSSFRAVYHAVFVPHVFAAGLAATVIGFLCWWRGVPSARFYSLAWLFPWLCAVAGEWQFLKRGTMDHLPWVYVAVGVAGGSTLFLVTLTDRVREIRLSASAAQNQRLSAERQASEALHAKLRQEQVLVRDLHDGVGSSMANVGILAEMGRRDASTVEESERFARISRLTTESGTEIRRLMSYLELQELTWLDFMDECQRYAAEVLPPHGIELNFTQSGTPDPAGPGVLAGLSLLRVYKEALTNAVKHSGCTRLAVRAEFNPQLLRLSVQDNGRGFPSGEHRGRGLRNMASRLREMGGQLTCRCADGTKLVFEVPLPVTCEGESAQLYS